jgi:hypothetical protein
MENYLATINSESQANIVAVHKLYGFGKITKIRCSENQGTPELFLTYESDAGKTVVLAYQIVKARGLLQFGDMDTETLDNLFEEYAVNWTEFNENRKAEAKAAREAKKEAEAQAKAEKEAQKKVEATLNKLNSMKPDDLARVCGTPTTEYETIGWLAKHVTNIKPSMPAEAQGWFEKKFGKVDCAKVYESGAKTTGKNPMKYTLSIDGSFNSEVPSTLARYISGSNNKHISSVEFFWSLIDKYGFQFGKKQDLDEIKKFVPDIHMSDFERGLAM